MTENCYACDGDGYSSDPLGGNCPRCGGGGKETPEIVCPACGVTVKQVASATLDLALWQHYNWVCTKRGEGA
jgi:hypothetical protein